MVPVVHLSACPSVYLPVCPSAGRAHPVQLMMVPVQQMMVPVQQDMLPLQQSMLPVRQKIVPVEQKIVPVNATFEQASRASVKNCCFCVSPSHIFPLSRRDLS